MYEPTIGLEIHVELKTRTKMFCDSLNNPNETRPNFNICPVCMGHPGTLPTINEEAINKLILAGLALNCKIATFSKFDRKNYFYPDLPKGYQISQYDMPICSGGYLIIDPAHDRKIHLERIHLEEDAGKLLHDEEGNTLVDFNRAGVPLMELVTKPEIKTPQEVERFARELQLILRYIGASDADIQKGQMRVEVNLSMAKKDSKELGTKVEIKNIGSINAAMRAAQYEIDRQTRILKTGEKIMQETRGWDDQKDQSYSQRTKEGSADYRYFPEPDLPPLRFEEADVEMIRSKLPELPNKRRERFKKQYNLNQEQIEVMTVNKKLGDFYENVISEALEWQSIKNGSSQSAELLAKLRATTASYMITNAPVLDNTNKITPENLAELFLKVLNNELSSTAAKTVLEIMAETGDDPDDVIKTKDLGQISDTNEIERLVAGVIIDNPQAVESYKKGKVESMKFLIGKVMAASKGKANPQIAQKLLENNLKKQT